MRDYYLFAKDLNGPNQRYYVELELSPEELQAIGLVTAQWAFLEANALEYATLLCAQTNSPVPKDITSFSHRKRGRAWEALVQTVLNGHPDLNAVLKVVRRMSDLLGDRHDVIHGFFQWNDSNPDKLNVHTRNRERPRAVDLAWLTKFGKEIATLNADLLWVHGIEFGVGGKLRRPGKPVRANPDLIAPFGGMTGPGVVGPTTRPKRKRQKPTPRQSSHRGGGKP